MNIYTGTVRKIEIEELPPYNPYKYWGGDVMEVFVVAQIEIDGLSAYFKVMAGTHSVRTGGPFAISLYQIGEKNPWVHELNKDKSVASPGVQAQNRLELKVHVGDTISVRARQKGEERTSRKGNRYISLTHVKFSPDSGPVRDDSLASGSTPEPATTL